MDFGGDSDHCLDTRILKGFFTIALLSNIEGFVSFGKYELF